MLPLPLLHRTGDALPLSALLKRYYTHLPQIIATKGVPIHLYADEIEPQAMAQVILLAESPLPVDYVSVMPDAHLGKGVTIGTVFARAIIIYLSQCCRCRHRLRYGGRANT